MALGGIQDHGLSWGQAILLVSPPVGPPCLLTLWGLSHQVHISSKPAEQSDVFGGEGAPVPVHACQVPTSQHFHDVDLSCCSQGLDGLALDPVRSSGEEEFMN